MKSIILGIKSVKLIDIPEYKDSRGALSFIEKDVLPFKMKRIFYLYDVPKDSFRGRHAHIEHLTFLVALNGSFEVTLIDAELNKLKIKLDRPNKGLYIPNMVWHELNNFSNGAVCLVSASDVHKEDDYIREFNEFIK